MQYLLAGLIGIAVYAGYKAWPLYTVLIVGSAITVWNLMYFSKAGMQIATGGPLAYLFRITAINIIQAFAFYGVGFGLHHLIG